MLNKEEQPSELLQRKPQRRTGPRLTPVFILLGVVVILGAVFIGAWRVYTTNSASAGTRPQIQTRGSTGKGGAGQTSWDSYPAVYWQTLRAQFAQELHMTEQQIKDNLHSTFLATQTPTNHQEVEFNTGDASKWLGDLARAQGISQSQLHAIEVTAVQRAHAVLVEQHFLTQQQADATIRGMNQGDLNMNIMEAFFMDSGKKGS